MQIQIKTTKDIKQFIDYLYNQNINFHWDDDFRDYVNYKNNRAFSLKKANKLNTLLEQSLKLNYNFLTKYTLKKYTS